MIKDLVKKNRSCRRFYEDYSIELEQLRELVELARLSASAGNLQHLKFILSCDTKKNALVFPHLGWAGYLKEWAGPCQGERPAAYIIMLGGRDQGDFSRCDQGIAAQSILLGAVEKGLAGCIIASIQREKLAEALSVPAAFEILLVLALGKGKEEVAIETVDSSGDIKYWRDARGIHHVPKRQLDDIIVG